MYFSFIGSYTSGLVLPAAAGILAHMLQVKHGMAGRATILCVAHVWVWLCGFVAVTVWLCGCDCVAVWLWLWLVRPRSRVRADSATVSLRFVACRYSMFIMTWSTVFLERWKRTQSRNAFRWNTLDFHLEEESAVAEFVKHPGTGEWVSRAGSVAWWYRRIVSPAVVLFMIGISCLVRRRSCMVAGLLIVAC